MGLLHEDRLHGQIAGDVAARGIRSRVRLLLPHKPEPDKHSQPVRFRGQQGLLTGEEEDLLGSRLPDSRKGSQGSLRLVDRPPNHGSEIAAKRLECDAGTLPEFGGECVLEDPTGGDSLERRLLGCQNRFRICTNRALEVFKSLTPVLRRCEIGHILP